MKKKLLTIILSLAMVLTMIPFATMTAFADSQVGQPLCFTSEGAGSIALNESGVPGVVSLEYSTDGSNWLDYAVGSYVTFSAANAKVYFRAKNVNKVFSNYYNTSDTSGFYCFDVKDTNVSASGDITTLLETNGVTDLSTTTDGRDWSYCFARLFDECTGLTVAPILPATTLADGCYWAMFYGCTALETAPELPAKNLAKRCYVDMFYDCTALKTAPKLPATTLAADCYQCMFRGCTSLETAPELPAKTLVSSGEYNFGCYGAMFSDCRSLKVAPELPATTLSQECYSSMFAGCTALETAPVLPAKALAFGCYMHMFDGCTALKTAPELPATTLPDGILDSKQSIYYGCYSYMFKGCTSLKTAPALPATNLGTYCYACMFYGCTSLETAPALPATTMKGVCYGCMFYGCTSLKTAPALPATNLAEACYDTMFYGCTSLKTAPALPATTLDTYCYEYMFYGCNNLTQIAFSEDSINASAKDALQKFIPNTTKIVVPLSSADTYKAADGWKDYADQIVGAYFVNIANTEHGVVKADKQYVATDAASKVVTLKAIPDTDFELESLTVTDAKGNPVTVTDNTFTMPDCSVNVTATFKKSDNSLINWKKVVKIGAAIVTAKTVVEKVVKPVIKSFIDNSLLKFWKVIWWY